MKGNFNKELKEYLEKLNVTKNVRTRIILALKRNDCYDFDELKERIKLKDLKGLGKYSLRILSNFVCNVEFSERKFMETEIDKNVKYIMKEIDNEKHKMSFEELEQCSEKVDDFEVIRNKEKENIKNNYINLIRNELNEVESKLSSDYIGDEDLEDLYKVYAILRSII